MLKESAVVPTMPVVDLDEARQFYEGILGLEPGPGTSEESAHYICGQGTQFLLYKRPTPTQADHTALGFTVDDFDAAFNELQQAGVQFEVYDMPHIKTDERGVATDDTGNRTAWFKDPGGNILAVGEFGP
ncbi:MAG: VOC family protein [Anaerolineales bacterium]